MKNHPMIQSLVDPDLQDVLDLVKVADHAARVEL